MAFAGTFGASAAMVPFGIIENARGEVGAGYDSDSRLKFARASGSLYTPARVDTLIIRAEASGGEFSTPPLDAIVAGLPSQANADTGALVSAIPIADQHGLPVNFGPGRGKWTERDLNRLRVFSVPLYIAPVVPGDARGHASKTTISLVAGNIVILVRNHDGTELANLQLAVELTHSMQD